MWPQTIKQGMPTKIPQCNLNSESQTYSLKSKTVQYSLTCPIEKLRCNETGQKPYRMTLLGTLSITATSY